MFVNAVVIAAGINCALSALIAWLGTMDQDSIPLWATPLKDTSTEVDTIGTLFVLPFLTTLIITTVIWHEIQNGTLTRLAHPSPALAERVPATRLRRALVIGLTVMVVLGPPAAVILALIDFDDLGQGEFVLYKAILGVVLGAVVTPPIARFAMADSQPVTEQPAETGATAATP
jgi:fructose-specific phosphotransferase system IIC component